MAQYEYNPLEIISFIETGITDFTFIMEKIEQKTVFLVIYEAEDEITHYFCSADEYEFLCRLYFRTESINHMTLEERDFIEVFISRGIIAEL